MDDRTTLGRQDESRALTGLRGLGALLVMLHHFYLHLPIDLRAPGFGGLLLKGYLGVDLFFVLSGFVMAMVYGPWFEGGEPGRTRRLAVFLVRRLARLWPLHAAVIVAVVVAELLHGVVLSPRLVAINLAMLQAWGVSAEINPPAWSISTELFVYLLFPLLAPVVLRNRYGSVIGLLVTVSALALCLRFAIPVGPVRRGPLDIYFNYSPLPLLRCLAGFVLGMVAWRAGRAPAMHRMFGAGWGQVVAGPAALAALIGLMLGRVDDRLIYPLLPVIVLGLHLGRGAVWGRFAQGPIYHLGVLSYAIYLVHVVLLLRFPFGWASPPVELAAFLVEVLAVALLAHFVVERPGRRLLRAWGEGLLGRALPRPAAAAPPLQGGPG